MTAKINDFEKEVIALTEKHSNIVAPLRAQSLLVGAIALIDAFKVNMGSDHVSTEEEFIQIARDAYRKLRRQQDKVSS